MITSNFNLRRIEDFALMNGRQTRFSNWFQALQSSLIAAFEKLEDEAGPLYAE